MAQAAAMTTLCAYAIDAEVMRELSIYQARACNAPTACARASAALMRVRSQAIELWRELCKPGGKPPQLAADEPDVTAQGPKAVAARWRELLRRGSAPEMRESKTAHLVASLERTGQTSHAPPGANPRRWRPSGASRAGGAVIWLTQVEMEEDGKPRVHPLERLLFPHGRDDDEEDDEMAW